MHKMWCYARCVATRAFLRFAIVIGFLFVLFVVRTLPKHQRGNRSALSVKTLFYTNTGTIYTHIRVFRKYMYKTAYCTISRRIYTWWIYTESWERPTTDDGATTNAFANNVCLSSSSSFAHFALHIRRISTLHLVGRSHITLFIRQLCRCAFHSPCLSYIRSTRNIFPHKVSLNYTRAFPWTWLDTHSTGWAPHIVTFSSLALTLCQLVYI